MCHFCVLDLTGKHSEGTKAQDWLFVELGMALRWFHDGSLRSHAGPDMAPEVTLGEPLIA